MATAQMLREWREISTWPGSAVADVWTFLRPLVEDPRSELATNMLRGYSQQHELGRNEVGKAGTLLHNLLLNAASLDLSKEAFAQDLAALGGGPVSDALLPAYDDAIRAIRLRLLRVALADHGKLLTNISWRVDVIGDSDATKQLASSVLLLTLGWQEGAENGRVTLQLTPDKIAELRNALERFAV
jgi:hypothetical protein